ncbi:MAG: hypothetical protein CL927_08015 [Deltaproteobacteria bacterium]|nr:hypothetical protein [Deltaproteobacteria bacterium]
MTALEDIQPAFLTLPEPGDRTYRTLLRKVRLQGVRHLLELSGSGPMGALRDPVQRAARKNSRALLQVVGLHDILTPLLCHRAGLCSTPLLMQVAIPSLLVALSRAGLLTESVLWPQALPHLLDPTRGLLVTHTAGALDGLVAHPDGIEVRHGSDFGRLDQLAPPFEVRPQQHTITPGLHLSLVDTNPLAMVEAHPDKRGNALSLSGRPVEEWVQALRQSTQALHTHLPEWTSALSRAPMRLVPVGFESERHLSASYREALGVAYLSLHPSTLTLAEAIVHEGQHSRLNTLLLLDPVLHNGTTAWTPSPVRPDLRPLNGVLLAAHAFVPVAVFHARLAAAGHPLSADPMFAARRAAVLVGNQRGLDTCQELADASSAGNQLMQALQRVHEWCCRAHPDGLRGARALCADALPEGVPLAPPSG